MLGNSERRQVLEKNRKETLLETHSMEHFGRLQRRNGFMANFFFSSSYRFFHPVIVMDKFIDGPALSMALLVPIETKNEEKNSVIDRYSIRKQ